MIHIHHFGFPLLPLCFTFSQRREQISYSSRRTSLGDSTSLKKSLSRQQRECEIGSSCASPLTLNGLASILVCGLDFLIQFCPSLSQSGRSKSRLFNPSSSSDDASHFLNTSFGGLGYANPQQSLSALNISQASFDNSLLRVSSTSGASTSGLSSNQRQDSKSNKPVNRWSGLWGSSAKVKETKVPFKTRKVKVDDRQGRRH